MAEKRVGASVPHFASVDTVGELRLPDAEIRRSSPLPRKPSIAGRWTRLPRSAIRAGWLEKVRPAPSAVPINRGVALRVVVEATIVCR